MDKILEQIFTANPELAQALKSTEHHGGVIAIDGRCASGKTTFACLLQAYFGQDLCSVIHMDDFFLQAHQRTQSRLKQVGGNVDFERFYLEVVEPILQHKAPSYRVFSCKSMSFLPDEIHAKANVIIAEGAYSHHPYFGGYMDLSVFLTVDEKEQLKRVLARSGENALQDFITKWIPMEEKYFAANSVAHRADFAIDNSNTKGEHC